MSNKAILPILHQLYPDDPRILPAFFSKPAGMRNYARKPILSREGANVQLVADCCVIASTDGEYSDGPFIWQQLCLDEQDGYYPVVGSWIVGGERRDWNQRKCTYNYRQSVSFCSSYHN